MRLRHVYGMLSADAVRCMLLVSPSQRRETLLQVGGLSVINAIAGAYSENLPVICIVGKQGIQSTCYLSLILHHSLSIVSSHGRGSKL